jgi:hypothetical protein
MAELNWIFGVALRWRDRVIQFEYGNAFRMYQLKKIVKSGLNVVIE